MSDKEFTAITVAALFLGLITVCGLAILAERQGNQDTLKDGYSRGYTDYCPASDKFAWKGECR
jgi:hypothetical protein